MSRPGPSPRTLPAALLLLAGLAVTAPLVDRELRLAVPPTPDVAPRPAGGFTAPPTAVDALRAGDCRRAVAEIGTATADERVVSGLYAHACGSWADALGQLLAAAGYSGPLADWRLWAVGESSSQLGQLETAQFAFTELAVDHSDSVLAEPALIRAAELAFERGDLAAVDPLVARGRGRALTERGGGRLEAVAWRTARERNDLEALEAVSRRLLVEHPITAAELGAVEVFRRTDGTVDWAERFTAEALARRARSLLAADLAASAIETLDEVPAAARGGDWTLLRAEALTLGQRGEEALDLLAGPTAESPQAETRAEWLRASAALEASVARSGRSTSAARRREWRLAAHRHLRRVVELGTDDELSRRALRVLFGDLADEGRFEAALDTLRALRQIEPGDETGAGFLWRHGWREFERRNHSSAIGYWAELRELYRDSTAARRALYWSARAYREMGNDDRSQALLHEVVSAPLADFYHRHAMEWLVEPPPPAAPATAERAPWPQDPSLARARWLSDLGLDAAARRELELLTAAGAERRAAKALLAEILAREGETRRSIVELRRAFPELGTHRQQQAPEAALRLYYPLEFDRLITEAARRQELSPHLVFAMIRQESAFDSGAHSHAGARGLMQVMPATGRELAGRLGLSYHRARLVDPRFSVQLGTAYYRQVLRSFGDEELALAGYNAGPNRIRRLWNRSGSWGEVDRFIESLPLEETRTYVQRIVLLSNTYRELYAG